MQAWEGPPELTRLMCCKQCGFRFFDRGLSREEAERYYRDYASETYLMARHRYEFFYTRKAYEWDRQWAVSVGRKNALAGALQVAGASARFAKALDYGGGNGQMLQGIDANEKAVFELREITAEPGVRWIGSREEVGTDWDLVLDRQVLEHTSDPLDQIRDISQMLANGGWLYAEVPVQHWRDISGLPFGRDAWLSWLLQHPRGLLAVDVVSTACRVKAGFVPPFGFVPMREHVNFFTVQALKALLTRAGLCVQSAGTNFGGIYAVATRA